MRPSKYFFGGFFLLLSAVWLLTDNPSLSALTSFMAWRNLLMQYSGVLAIGVMSVAMILAVRPKLAEPSLGGLDKMYRLHKWLGISGLVLAVAHWLLSEAPKWLSQLGWITRGPRGPRPVLPEGSVQQVLASQRGLAESMGEFAFYAVVILLALALIKRFPYKLFFKTHKLIAIVYLALVWHSVVLLTFQDWSGLLGVVMGLLMAAGSVAAVVVLVGRLAVHRRVPGQVLAVAQHPTLQVLQVDVSVQGRWPGHNAGQFAFVTFHPDEGAHPYTISSAWRDDGRLSFLIKALGDYTDTLAQRIQVHDPVQVEGPYGRFNFEGDPPTQIWIGAGIGITPFVARMAHLTTHPDGKSIHLFHTTRVMDAHAISLLARDAQTAHVNLQVLWDERDGLLTADRIMQDVPQWRDADVWFCGPTAFGQSLRHDLLAQGLPAARFHQELFEMR